MEILNVVKSNDNNQLQLFSKGADKGKFENILEALVKNEAKAENVKKVNIKEIILNLTESMDESKVNNKTKTLLETFTKNALSLEENLVDFNELLDKDKELTDEQINNLFNMLSFTNNENVNVSKEQIIKIVKSVDSIKLISNPSDVKLNSTDIFISSNDTKVDNRLTFVNEKNNDNYIKSLNRANIENINLVKSGESVVLDRKELNLDNSKELEAIKQLETENKVKTDSSFDNLNSLTNDQVSNDKTKLVNIEKADEYLYKEKTIKNVGESIKDKPSKTKNESTKDKQINLSVDKLKSKVEKLEDKTINANRNINSENELIKKALRKQLQNKINETKQQKKSTGEKVVVNNNKDENLVKIKDAKENVKTTELQKEVPVIVEEADSNKNFRNRMTAKLDIKEQLNSKDKQIKDIVKVNINKEKHIISDKSINFSSPERSEGSVVRKVDKSNVIKQVVDKIEYEKSNFKENIKVELKPKDLGKLEIEVTRKAGKIQASFIVESEEVKSIIQERSNQLIASFETKNIDINDIKYIVRKSSEQNVNYNFSNNDESSGQHNQSQYANKYAEQLNNMHKMNYQEQSDVADNQQHNNLLIRNSINIFV